MANDYKEQVQFDDGMEDLDRTTSLGGAGGQMQDMQAQLAAAATPLEYQATLETKFASYDNYCNLFHYILNSEGPVDLEVPSVSIPLPTCTLPKTRLANQLPVLLGLGCNRRIHLPIRILLPLPQPRCPHLLLRRRIPTSARQPQHLGLLLRSQRPLQPNPTLADQRATRCHETQRGPHVRRRRIRLAAPLPHAGLLQHHRPLACALPPRRLQPRPQNPRRH